MGKNVLGLIRDYLGAALNRPPVTNCHYRHLRRIGRDERGPSGMHLFGPLREQSHNRFLNPQSSRGRPFCRGNPAQVTRSRHIGALDEEVVEATLPQGALKIFREGVHRNLRPLVHALPSTKLIAVESFAQLCSSVWSCFRPDAVNE